MLDGFVNGLDSFFVWLNSFLKQNLSDYSDLETAQDEYTLVAKDGSLLSIIRIDGYRSLINNTAFFEKISDPLSKGLDPFLSSSAHAIQVWFAVDPTKSKQVVKNALSPSYETIKRLGMELDEILDERVVHIADRCNYEECYLVLWTTPAELIKSEKRQEMENKKKMRTKVVAPVNALQTGDVFAANGMILNSHSSYVDNVEELLFGIGLACKKLSVHEAARCVRSSIDSDFTDTGFDSQKVWKPFLPGDKISPNVRRKYPKAEEWDIVWPKLSWQVCPRDAKIINDKMVEIGDKLYAPGYIDLMPKEIQSFGGLFASLNGKFPWRISFLIEGDGLASITTKALFASLLGFLGGDNKLLNNGAKTLRDMKESYGLTVVKSRVSFCTWNHKTKVTEVEKQLSEMSRALQGWGSCEVSEVTGDPLAGVMSSAVGNSLNSVATPSAVPLDAVTFMMPFNRPSSAWEQGAVLFVSPDMKLIPYQPMGSEQSTWINLIFAKPGSGKSVLMNVSNLGLCLSPGIPRLPRIGICDIGPSSSGLISLLKESLDVSRRHLVQYYRIRMTEEYCVNPMDTHLGCRYPTAEDMAFLSNFVLLLVTEPGKEEPEDGMPGLVQAILQDAYYRTSDKGTPKRYDLGVDELVDEAVKKSGIHIDVKTSWWEIGDELFKKGFVHEAMVAQRHAVPLLSELTTSSQDEKIKSIYGKVIPKHSETLIENFNRLITDALNQYKILSRPTVFDIGEARVVALDLDEVAKSGGIQADRQTAVMYLLARYILGKDFKMGVETVNEMPYPGHIEAPSTVPVKEYKFFHKKKIEETREDKKRLCFDEFHRTSNSKMVRNQVVVDMREGRKWNLDVTLASQNLKDFDEVMTSFATGVFIMDGGTEKDIQEIVDTFGMDDPAERYFLSSGRVKPPRNGRPGVFMAKFMTSNGKFTQLLSANIGAIEMWALSTTAEDVAVRSKLYEKLPPAQARSLLAHNFPNGIKKYVEQRRISMKASGMYSSGEDDANLYDQIVDEILKKSGLIRF